MEIRIEAKRGNYRIENGKYIGFRYAADYGEIVGTKGADGEPIDVYKGLFPDSESVFIINQYKDGKFDEHKVMIDFFDLDQAKSAYSITTGEEPIQSFTDKKTNILSCSKSQLNWWLEYGDHKKPVTTNSLPFDTEQSIMDDIILWDDIKNTSAKLIYDFRKTDDGEELLEAATMDDVLTTELEDGAEIEHDEATFDALVIQNKKLERTANLIGMAFNRASQGIKVAENGVQISKPMKQNGTTNIAVLFEMTDGQTVTVFLHNPDTTPQKITPDDALISWKWLLNRKDITIVVAKENGRDLAIQQVARRVMALVEKNTARFAKANAKRAERVANLAKLEAEIQAKETELEGLLEQIKNGGKDVVNQEEENKKDIEEVNKKAPVLLHTARTYAMSPGYRAEIEGRDEAIKEFEQSGFEFKPFSVESPSCTFAVEKKEEPFIIKVTANWYDTGKQFYEINLTVADDYELENGEPYTGDVGSSDSISEAIKEANSMLEKAVKEFGNHTQDGDFSPLVKKEQETMGVYLAISKRGKNKTPSFQVFAKEQAKEYKAHIRYSGVYEESSFEGSSVDELTEKIVDFLRTVSKGNIAVVKFDGRGVDILEAGTDGKSLDELLVSGSDSEENKPKDKAINLTELNDQVESHIHYAVWATLPGENYERMLADKVRSAITHDGISYIKSKEVAEYIANDFKQRGYQNVRIQTIDMGGWFNFAKEALVGTKKQDEPKKEVKEVVKEDEPIQVNGNELGEFDTSTEEGKKALREAAFNYLKGLAENNETVYCAALGADVGFDKAGAKKYKQISADDRKLRLTGQIKEIIAKGVKFKESQESYDINEQKEGLKYHYIKSPVVIDGVTYGVRVVIRERDGHFFYDTQVKDSIEAIMDSLNVKSGKPVSVNKSDVSYRDYENSDKPNEVNKAPVSYRHSQVVEPPETNISHIADDSQAIFDDTGKYVLNLFLYDENGNEIKDEEEVTKEPNQPSEDTQEQLDKEYLNKVINGEVDMMADDFEESLEKVVERYSDKGGELEELAMKAVDAYSKKLDELSA